MQVATPTGLPSGSAFPQAILRHLLSEDAATEILAMFERHVSQALFEQFIASFARPLKSRELDLAHSEWQRARAAPAGFLQPYLPQQVQPAADDFRRPVGRAGGCSAASQ